MEFASRVVDGVSVEDIENCPLNVFLMKVYFDAENDDMLSSLVKSSLSSLSCTLIFVLCERDILEARRRFSCSRVPTKCRQRRQVANTPVPFPAEKQPVS